MDQASSTSIPGMQTPVIPAFDNSLGALMIGGLLAMALWGITCIQTYNFFYNNTRDRPAFKLLIVALFVVDTLHAAICCHILYHYMVSNYLNPLAIAVPTWSVITLVTITSISDFIIRTLFGRRVYRLSSGNIPITVLIAALSLGDLLCGLIITGQAFAITTFLELDELSTMMYLNFGLGTSSDLVLAIALCYWLYISRTGLPKTNSLINTLILYSVNTGMIVAIDAAMGVVTYAVMPHNLIFLGFYMLLSKLYLNSYLASLNAREGLRETSVQPVSIHFSDLPPSSQFTHEQLQSHLSSALPHMTTREKRSFERSPSEELAMHALKAKHKAPSNTSTSDDEVVTGLAV